MLRSTQPATRKLAPLSPAGTAAQGQCYSLRFCVCLPRIASARHFSAIPYKACTRTGRFERGSPLAGRIRVGMAKRATHELAFRLPPSLMVGQRLAPMKLSSRFWRPAVRTVESVRLLSRRKKRYPFHSLPRQNAHCMLVLDACLYPHAAARSPIPARRMERGSVLNVAVWFVRARMHCSNFYSVGTTRFHLALGPGHACRRVEQPSSSWPHRRKGTRQIWCQS